MQYHCSGSSRVHDEPAVLLESTIVRDTKPRMSDGMFGRGISLQFSEHGSPGRGTIRFSVIERNLDLGITESRIEGSARAGIGIFGANVRLGSTALDCNAIHLDGEPFGDSPFTLENLGGNQCGCDGQQVECKVLSANLAPPPPVELE